MTKQKVPVRLAAKARYGPTMQGKKAVLAAGVLYCKMPYAGFLLFERNWGEEKRMISALACLVSRTASVLLLLIVMLHLSSLGEQASSGCFFFESMELEYGGQWSWVSIGFTLFVFCLAFLSLYGL
jgi:hypothetical protein